jgi:hypothetical protein
MGGFLDGGDEVDQQVHVAQGLSDLQPHVAPRGDHEHVAPCQGLGVRGHRFILDLRQVHGVHDFMHGPRELEHEGGVAVAVMAFDHQAHRPGRLLESLQVSESRRRGNSTSQPGWSGGRCSKRQVMRAWAGHVLKSIVNSMNEWH